MKQDLQKPLITKVTSQLEHIKRKWIYGRNKRNHI